MTLRQMTLSHAKTMAVWHLGSKFGSNFDLIGNVSSDSGEKHDQVQCFAGIDHITHVVKLL